MNYTIIVTIIALAELILLIISVMIIVLVLKSKKQRAIDDHNKRIEERDRLIRELENKGKAYDKKIKKISNRDDFVNLYNDIMQNYGDKN